MGAPQADLVDDGDHLVRAHPQRPRAMAYVVLLEPVHHGPLVQAEASPRCLSLRGSAYQTLDPRESLAARCDGLRIDRGDPALQGHRFLVLIGDTEKKLKHRMQRILVATPLIKLVERQARSAGIDLTHITMSGHGHEQPPAYLDLIGTWARGETLPEVK